MTPPTVNAYYDPSMNDINFPAGILQPAFYDRTQDDAVNYGHIGAIIGHELTHGFDDEGKQVRRQGQPQRLVDPDDTKKFEARTDCLVNEYGSFTAVDDVKVNGKLTLGENTADNGGLLLAYMAYMQRAKEDHIDLDQEDRRLHRPAALLHRLRAELVRELPPRAVRSQVLTDPHSPDHFRANGAIVNQPGFAAAFSCKKPPPHGPRQQLPRLVQTRSPSIPPPPPRRRARAPPPAPPSPSPPPRSQTAP
jgi:putative endopeptidase